MTSTGTKRQLSIQETDNITDRDLLANVFETLSKSSAEYEMIQEYKSQISTISKLSDDPETVRGRIRRIRFTTEI